MKSTAFVQVLEASSLHRRSFLSALTAFAAAPFVPSLSSAAQHDPMPFRDDLQGSNLRLKLIGTGVYYYSVFIKVAAAAFYLEDSARNADVLANVAKRLEMQYFRGVQAKDLISGSAALLARNLQAETLTTLQPQIDQMHNLYQNVVAGDRSALTYVPGVGTSLELNGTKLGTVGGADFASAYFSIWFGQRPIDPGLKRKLLGG
jgi:hypothetical protein